MRTHDARERESCGEGNTHTTIWNLPNVCVCVHVCVWGCCSSSPLLKKWTIPNLETVHFLELCPDQIEAPL